MPIKGEDLKVGDLIRFDGTPLPRETYSKEWLTVNQKYKVVFVGSPLMHPLIINKVRKTVNTPTEKL